MSGGVDSSVAASLLKEMGYEVVGATMRIWKGGESRESVDRCCGAGDVEDARRVAQQIRIPFYVVNLAEEFEREVIQYFCEEYRRGKTPNPCILCNERVKFGSLLKKARELDADYLATGHYARVEFDEKTGRYGLKKGVDQRKDQSYVLFSLTQEQLHFALFPLGEYRKEKVRQQAFELGLRVHDKPESQEICFIQEASYHSFLLEKLGESIEPGPILDREGRVLGTHQGIPFYTVGQRRGLRLAVGRPLYVVEIDRAKNAIIVGEEEEVYGHTFTADSVNWIASPRLSPSFSAYVKIRYNHPGSEAILSATGEDKVVVRFKEPQKAITPGQAAVFYEKDQVLGGGWIKEIIK